MPKLRELPWGKILFVTLALISCLDLVSRGSSGHFDIFRNSARILWEQKNPYGILYPSAYYLYSPFCGMSIFSLFAWLPYKLDLFLYAIISCVILFISLKKLSSAFSSKQKKLTEIFFALVAFEMIGSILNAKLEIIMTGLLIISFMALWKNPKNIWAPLVLAIICNWKFQPLPAVGLFLWAQALKSKNFQASVLFTFGLILSFVLPGFYLGFEKLSVFHQDWSSSLNAFMRGGQENWLGFQHIFQAIRTFTGYSVSYYQATIIACATATALLGFWTALIRTNKLNQKDYLLWPLSAGATFACCVSPLSQSAAFILAAPLFLALLIELKEKHSLSTPLKLLSLIAFYGVVASYSDMTPKFLRELLRTASFKPLSLLLMFLIYSWLVLLRSKTQRNTTP